VTDDKKTYRVHGQLWNPIPLTRRIVAASEVEAKVAFIEQVAKDWGFSEGKVRQNLYIEGGGGGMRKLADIYEQPGHKQTVWLKFRGKHVGAEGDTTLYPHSSLAEFEVDDEMMCDYGDLYVEGVGEE